MLWFFRCFKSVRFKFLIANTPNWNQYYNRTLFLIYLKIVFKIIVYNAPDKRHNIIRRALQSSCRLSLGCRNNIILVSNLQNNPSPNCITIESKKQNIYTLNSIVHAITSGSRCSIVLETKYYEWLLLNYIQ